MYTSVFETDMNQNLWKKTRSRHVPKRLEITGVSQIGHHLSKSGSEANHLFMARILISHCLFSSFGSIRNT